MISQSPERFSACPPPLGSPTPPVQTSYSNWSDASAPRNTPRFSNHVRITRWGEKWALFRTNQPSRYGNQVVLGSGLIVGTGGEIARKQAAVFAALVKVHIHNLEGHILGTRIAHERRNMEISHPDLESQLYL